MKVAMSSPLVRRCSGAIPEAADRCPSAPRPSTHDARRSTGSPCAPIDQTKPPREKRGVRLLQIIKTHGILHPLLTGARLPDGIQRVRRQGHQAQARIQVLLVLVLELDKARALARVPVLTATATSSGHALR